MKKVCTQCKKSKHEKSFRIRKGNKTFSSCLMCEREYRRKQSRINVIPPILGRAKRRAKEKNINFDLTTSYLEKLLEKTNMICPIMKKKMIISKGQKTKYSLSIDKIDPKKGYVQGNVRFISDIANRILTNATKEEIKKVYSFFKK